MSKSYLIPFSLVMSGSALMILACQNFQKPVATVTETSAEAHASLLNAGPAATPFPTLALAPLPMDEAISGLPGGVDEAPNTQPTTPPDTLPAIHSELSRVKRCLTTMGTPQACQFESTDAQEWPIEISKSLIAELASLHRLYTTGGGSVAADQHELTEITREFLNYPEDNVQLAALKIAALLPPDRDVAKDIVRALDQSISAQLFGEGIDQLYRMNEVVPSAQLDQLLMRGMTRHSAETSDMIARRALTFLTDQNIAMFTRFAATLSPRSEAYRDMKSNIAEFHRQQTGG